jgi:hypothetical protein
MNDIYALLVGINEYADPKITNLAGCVNDVRAAAAFLEERRRPGTRLMLKELVNGQATGAAIVDGIRVHLRRAGPGDVALFWFSGHGSTAPVGTYWRLEPNGTELQTLVCVDSRVDGRPELLDKELGVLLDELAERGCHVVAVLDSCHSGGGTRDGSARPALDETARSVERATTPWSYTLVPDLAERYASGAPPVRHVLLAACRPEEKAREYLVDGVCHGRFSRALLDVLNGAPADTTVWEIVALARNAVERGCATQRPMVFPAGWGLANASLFGGGMFSDPPTFTMRHGRDGWQVNAGEAHGMVAGRTRLAIDGDPARALQVTEIQTGRSQVAPLGWSPDPDQVYRLVIARPARTTLFGIAANPVPDEFAALRTAVGADPSIDFVDVTQAELILTPELSGVRLTSRDNQQIVTLPTVPSAADLLHIARWWRVRTLSSDDSRIRYGIVLEVVERKPGELIAPRQRHPSWPDQSGTLRVAYEANEPPSRFLRLRNTTNQPLYCVLLNLTERFRITSALFPAGLIAAGATAAVAEGQVIEFTVPDSWSDRPISEYRDWLMVIASTDEIDAAPYEMPNLPIFRNDQTRDIVTHVGATPPRGAWWTYVLPVITTGPATRHTTPANQ